MILLYISKRKKKKTAAIAIKSFLFLIEYWKDISWNLSIFFNWIIIYFLQ